MTSATPRRHRAAAWACCAWLAFFVVSHVLAVIFPGEDPTGDGPWGRTAYVVYNVVLIAMAAAGAVLVLAAVRPWGRRLPRPLVLVPLWFGSVLLVVRGVPGMAENVLVVTGVAPHGLLGTIDGAEADPGTRQFWTSMAVNAYFFLGAVTLLPVARAATRRRPPSPGTRAG
ncbi:DUF3995 domain-containing protein [Thermomonospora cellulosilytica]|uniref:DUF3995 domain-containing protein n=1 Tax=Thermomonospora cellulosilytica TaxID=1411118 RepID=A0A7W3R903_9ACTN|nr:DUF3995 domain-containing protein [Thermomonospora cellulosilytica]MBA9004124.1 hypothetical protein [Thermomonospora cellulosilytica]